MMQLMKTRVSLRYRGPALDAGRMDVYQASTNMIAFSEFMVAAVKSTYGDSAEAKAEVAGFEHGSFVTDIVISVGGGAATIFTALTPQQLWGVVRDAFALWKHLKGSPPTSVVHHDHSVQVGNNSGTILTVHTDALTLVMSPKGVETVEKFIRQPMEQDGYDTLQILPDDEESSLVSVTKQESGYFVGVAKELQLSDNVNRMSVFIVAAVFQDGNKWRFSDGGSTFNAAILDGDFLGLINRGERFGKGDVLDVDMQIVQTRTGMKVNVERSVVKVHRHLSPQEQSSLLL